MAAGIVHRRVSELKLNFVNGITEYVNDVLRGQGDEDINKGRYPTFLRAKGQRDRVLSNACARCHRPPVCPLPVFHPPAIHPQAGGLDIGVFRASPVERTSSRGHAGGAQ
eukprot:5506149-Pleurochrysis_carterae.AAC.1